MRLALINRFSSKVGGVETYLEAVISGLAELGHEIVFLSEQEPFKDVPIISLPPRTSVWFTGKLGYVEGIARLKAWCPDAIYLQSISDLSAMNQLLTIAPVVAFKHDHSGLCISGTKLFASPRPQPCSRRCGSLCLLLYYPRRCGGLNAWRMIRLYREHFAQLDFIRNCASTVTASEYMRRELLRYGLDPKVVHSVRLPIRMDHRTDDQPYPVPESKKSSPEVTLLFVGRMTKNKGGEVAIDAAALAARILGRPIKLVLIGDGSERASWTRKAAKVQSASGSLTIEFTGWLEARLVGRFMDEAELLVLPSLWPEPFGLVGPEAGSHRLPAVAFNVGGIGEWLIDGVNGHLATGDRPDASGLADAIVRCLRDPGTYRQLREGAMKISRRYSMDAHLEQLVPILQNAARKNSHELRQSM